MNSVNTLRGNLIAVQAYFKHKTEIQTHRPLLIDYLISKFITYKPKMKIKCLRFCHVVNGCAHTFRANNNDCIAQWQLSAEFGTFGYFDIGFSNGVDRYFTFKINRQWFQQLWWADRLHALPRTKFHDLENDEDLVIGETIQYEVKITWNFKVDRGVIAVWRKDTPKKVVSSVIEGKANTLIKKTQALNFYVEQDKATVKVNKFNVWFI